MTQPFTAAALLALEPYSLDRSEKEASLLARLNELSALHVSRCEPYRRIVEGAFPAVGAERMADVPYLPVRIFKTHLLRSVPETAVYKTLTSSGTTGSMPSRITLDQETAQVQARLLINLLGDFVGKQRRPMLIVDAPPAGGRSVSARYAATLGVMNLGRDHFFCLDESLALKKEALTEWLATRTPPFLVFGFTFMLWKYLYEAVGEAGLDLKDATVLHTGGWKKLLDAAVDNDAFKSGLRTRLNVGQVHNFYGMAEQVGTVFIECEEGVLHASDGSDVIIRDERTWREVERGGTGLVQCLSALPTSYPGHSLLTEDIGTLLGDDDCPCGRRGRYFKIIGRVPSAELRGCSDTRS
jgi:phenylacetate-coenzyme A ligase PaaK-like adenylate-forming protein